MSLASLMSLTWAARSSATKPPHPLPKAHTRQPGPFRAPGPGRGMRRSGERRRFCPTGEHAVGDERATTRAGKEWPGIGQLLPIQHTARWRDDVRVARSDTNPFVSSEVYPPGEIPSSWAGNGAAED